MIAPVYTARRSRGTLAQWLAAKLGVTIDEAARRLAEARVIAQRQREESDAR